MVLLISAYENKMFFEDLGISRIAAFLETKGIPVSVEYIKCGADISQEVVDRFVEHKYIGFSVYDNNIDYIETIAHRIKRCNKRAIIFYGSQYVSAAYNSILDSNSVADFLVIGDGEYPIFDFLRMCEGMASIYDRPNIGELLTHSRSLVSKDYRRERVPSHIDINELPWPIHNEAYLKQSMHVDLNTSSGCIGNCSFCGSLRRKWSGRSPESVYEEIRGVAERYRIRCFSFADSTLEDPGESGKQRILKLLDLLQNVRETYSFSANIRAESFEESPSDISMLKRMRSVGFAQLFVGIEAGNEADLKLYNKRANLRQNGDILDLLRACGIAPFWGFIMFNPYSEKKRLLANYEFLTSHQTYITYHFISFLTLYNGTPIYQIAKGDNLLKTDGRNRIEYEFRDQDTRALFDFVNRSFLQDSILKDIRETREILHFYNYMRPLIDTTKEDDFVSWATKQLAEVNREYFSALYLKPDLSEANKMLADFKQQISNYATRLRNVKLSIMKSYYAKTGA